ncbi:uncharacterized protein N0V89_010495 [Didymosphaeria variabile]|uniref:DNA (cytosine-5-)-methyltransferase n=1 Tax=Didymosphaeria variabile TaxID=1932322 RepID=A0A9W9C681_9PLEO|nr:uncharacterized protein N0V89_010495 [Didymosphaeria variabile]KAJ4346564.1 hypothetical protein N0V89_010495 [Didymosphaeria variabile]
MPPISAQGGTNPRSRSPAVVIRKSSSSTRTFTDEGHFPRHYDKAWKHAVRRKAEVDAISSLKAAWNAQQRAAYQQAGYENEKKPLYIDVSDYEIYTNPETNFIGELHSLDYMDLAGKKLFFNGVLSIGDTQHYVQGVPVKSYSIEGYGVDDDPNTTVYIVSPETSNDRGYDIWYRLGAPSRHYKRFQDAFQWVATLGKHVMDFLEEQQNMGLADFRRKFDDWLQRRFLNNADLSKWRKTYGSTDFRKILHAHISYLWSEAVCLQNDDVLLQHPLWKQCERTDNGMIEPKCEKTVATPHVYKCFKNRYFAGQIMEMQPSSAVLATREHRVRVLGFPSERHSSSAVPSRPSHYRKQYEVGDVVCIAPDDFENRMWRKAAKDAATVHEWIGYVQRVTPLADGRQRLYVIWLYRPEDTTISTTDYPITKELFMSDNCNCQEHKLLSSEVVRRCSVQWFSRGYNTRNDFLVRQKYETKSSSFMTMKETDFRCTCESSASASVTTTYRLGETVYLREKDNLEPVVIEEDADTTAKQVKVRRLLRLEKFRPETFCGLSQPQRRAAANELVWTDNVEDVQCVRIEVRCYVRFFSTQDMAAGLVQFPYDQGGTGHCWTLSTRLANAGQRLEDLTTAPQNLREGPDYTSLESSKKLPGLSLFSGLGNLDKGLEAGGAVHFHTSVDMNGRAIQTLRANAENSEQLKLWFGSVDDYLHALLSNESPNMKLVAKIGDVAVIAGGSPCPGFSKLQQNWLSEQSLRNAAHVTTFASFVDVYRPEYGFLENVVNMGVTRKGFEEELVLSQLIGCLVSMGYQVQQFIMSSWHYGSPQHRNRLILSIAAPGRTPLAPPRATHGDPDGFKSKSVGRLLNGERFGVQDAQLTPFRHVTPGEKLGHLPYLGAGVRHPCIRSPDHVLRCRPNIRERRCMAHVPTDPPGVGLEYAAKRGLVPKYLYETRSEVSGKSYRRIKKDGLIGTIVTAPSPHDSRAGPFVHWEQNRCITLEEARLAQDIPPEEILIGNVNDQYKMVGNAVDRRVSKALGLELRRAVHQDDHRTVKTRSVSVVINVKRQSYVNIPRPTTDSQAEEKALRIAQSIDQDIDMRDKSDDSRTLGASDTATVSRSTSQEQARRSTNSKTSSFSHSKSSSNTVPEVDDEEDQPPVPRGRRRNAYVPLSNSATISRIPTEQREQEAQLEREFGFDLEAKPRGAASWDDATVEYDAPATVPALAMSRKGFLRQLSESFSVASSSRRSSLATPGTPALLSAESPNRSDSELPLRTKRSRDQSEVDEDRTANSSAEKMSANKRVKGTEKPYNLMVEFTTAENTPEREWQDEVSRKTRHSGLGLEFVPQTWHKRVETEVKAKDKTVKKPSPRPYA